MATEFVIGADKNADLHYQYRKKLQQLEELKQMIFQKAESQEKLELLKKKIQKSKEQIFEYFQGDLSEYIQNELKYINNLLDKDCSN